MSDNTDPVDTSAPSTPTGLRRGAFTGYRWTLLAFLVLGVVQIFLAGVGVFNLNGEKLGTPGETAFDPHRVLGFVMGVVAVIILVLALIARAGSRAIILSVLLVLLTALAQSILADLGEDTPFFGGLHAFDGLVILGIAGFLHSAAQRR
jgi:hypothetical protein